MIRGNNKVFPIDGLYCFMAQEEAKHKLRLETEYDDIVLAED